MVALFSIKQNELHSIIDSDGYWDSTERQLNSFNKEEAMASFTRC